MCQHALSRRGFFERVALGSPAGASILDPAWRRAAWAQAMALGSPTDLFEIQSVTEGVYFAFARPQAVGNCNAAIFVNSTDVLVVDAHSKPSAAAGLIAQIKQQVTTKPVRYLVDTHFHWDHSQVNSGYRDAFGKDLKIIASDTTKKLQSAVLTDAVAGIARSARPPVLRPAAYPGVARRGAAAVERERLAGAEGANGRADPKDRDRRVHSGERQGGPVDCCSPGRRVARMPKSSRSSRVPGPFG